METVNHQAILDIIMWIAAGAGAVAASFLGIWWKVESKQDRKIDDLKVTNENAHTVLHRKIDRLGDKIEDIWKHLVRSNHSHRGD